MEAVPIEEASTGDLAVAVRNSGNSTAKRPWFTIAVGNDTYVNANVGPGFLGVDGGRYVITPAVYPEDAPDSVSGVVGCRHPRTNKLIGWSIHGGRHKKLRKGEFEAAYRKVHGNAPKGRLGQVHTDRSLYGLQRDLLTRGVGCG